MVVIDLSPSHNGGILKEIIKEGIGDTTPTNRCIVKVHYTGTLIDGTKFDSSRDRNEPFEFDLKKGKVIKAWDIGVATMKKGEIAILTCAPKYAYGKNGSPPKIPPNATLKFEIELISWKGQDISYDEDGSIEREYITLGKTFRGINNEALIQLHLTGMYNGKVFEDRDVEFHLGEGENHGIISGVELALKYFRCGEKSKLKIASIHAFKDKGKPEFGIPPYATVEYIVELKNFKNNEPDKFSLSLREKIEEAKKYREKGIDYFKSKQYNLAIKMFNNIQELRLHMGIIPIEEEKEAIDGVWLSTNLNLALCYLKNDQFLKAKLSCNQALTIDPRNVKAMFRKGLANLGLLAPEMAIKDFQDVLKIEPKNTAAAKQIVVCNNLMMQHLVKEKKLYANMFDKFAKVDREKEEEKLRQQPDVMRGALGEWGQEERPGGRDATAFEKENPNILMLNANGTGEFQNM